jgi:dTDP-glucose pyrophosphorylase
VNKAVILAAGLGTRMRKADEAASLTAEQAKIAATGVKALMPVDIDGKPARPFLDYVLTALADAGYTQVCLVIGPDHHALRDYYAGLPKQRLAIDFAVQAKPLGTANAVAAAEAFCAGDDFLMINSDNYYPPQSLEGLRNMSGNGVALFHKDAMIAGSNIDADRIQKFAAVELDAAGHMKKIHEKPSAETLAALGNEIFVSMNCWRFTKAIFDACRAIKPSPRGEYEVTDAAQHVIDVIGQPFGGLKFNLPVLDMSSRGDITAVGRKLAGVVVRL